MKMAIYIKQRNMNEPSNCLMDNYERYAWGSLILNKMYPIIKDPFGDYIRNNYLRVCDIGSVNGNRYFKIIEGNNDNTKGI